MMDENTIVAYRHKGEWLPADEVQTKRDEMSKKSNGEPYLPDANPYSLKALRRRREYGRDVPKWVKLDE